MAEGIKRADLEFDAAKKLACTRCSRIPVGADILQCANGHIICDNCFLETEACFNCQIAFDKTNPIKCVGLVVAVMDTILFACPFKSLGCTEPDMARAKLKEHLDQTCEFRNNLQVPGPSKKPSAPKINQVLRMFQKKIQKKYKKKKSNSVRCPFCETSCFDWWNTARHVARIHNKGKNDNAGKRGLFCPFCEEKMDQKDALRKHISQLHKDKF